MNVLVTGGGGFLGGAIVRGLVQQGHHVRSLSRSRYAALDALGVEQHQGDIGDPQSVEIACAGCDAVFHVAAKAGLGGRWRDYYFTNVVGTNRVIESCRKHRIRRLVYTSSPSVVFDGRDMEGVNESVPYPKRYEAHYPRSKALAERAVLAANGPELATVSLRPHLIWGPGDNHLVPRLLKRARQGRLSRIGSDTKRIDSVYIDNAADAHLLALERLLPGSAIAGKAYFISNGEPMPTWELINRILAAGGVAPVTRVIPESAAWLSGAICETLYSIACPDCDPPMTRFLARELATSHWFDLSAARRDLGYEPGVTIDEGLRRLEEWLKERGADLQWVQSVWLQAVYFWSFFWSRLANHSRKS
jgi:nucleoside-diphosphate-sugar epimerase